MSITIQCVLSFVGGCILGFTIRTIQDHLINKTTSRKNTRALLEEVISFVILGAWLTSVLVQLAYPERDVPIAVHMLMGAVVGFIYKTGNPILPMLKKGDTIDDNAKNPTGTTKTS